MIPESLGPMSPIPHSVAHLKYPAFVQRSSCHLVHIGRKVENMDFVSVQILKLTSPTSYSPLSKYLTSFCLSFLI